MAFTFRPPIGPGWFIFFQDTPDKLTGDGFTSSSGQMIQPGQSITDFNKYDIQSNNKVIVLTELGVF